MIYTGVGLTESFEGLRTVAYQDSGGVWTCGYGHTSGVTNTTTCTQQIAEEWLLADVQHAVDHINNAVKVKLTQDEFNALVDFVFNIGTTAFDGSTMLKLLNSSDYTGAALQFQRWDMAGGNVVAGLLLRREAEEKEFDGQTPTA